MARLSFNAHEVEDNGDGGGGGGSFQALSTGEYTCVVHDTDIRRTKKGDGSYLLIVWEVVEGLFKGQRVWDGIMREHPSAKTVSSSYHRMPDMSTLERWPARLSPRSISPKTS